MPVPTPPETPASPAYETPIIDAPPPDAHRVTELLRAWSAGDFEASEALAPILYAELRREARRALRREGDAHTLQPTALVHEAWLRLDGQHDAHWKNRAHFLVVAGRMMRRVLVDHARTRRALKRGGAAVRVTLGAAEHGAVGDVDVPQRADAPDAVDLLALDDALTRLAALDPQKARLIDLRYFAGLSIPEAAEALGVSVATVGREWAVARMWLRRELDA